MRTISRWLAVLSLVLCLVPSALGASRYWVGGTNTWNATAGSKWALTSGGAGGQAIPTATDDVFFDAASGASVVTVSGSRVAKTITCTGFTGSLTSTGDIAASGSVLFVATMTLPWSGTLSFLATASLTSGGNTISGGLTVNTAGIVVTLQDDLNLGAAGVLAVTQGTFNANDKNVTCGSAQFSGSSTRTITMGAGTWDLGATGTVWSTLVTTGLTFTPGGTIRLSNSSATARTVTTNSIPIGNLQITAGTGTVTLTAVICNDLDWSGFAGTWANADITVKGSLTLAAGMTITAGVGTMTVGASSGTKTLRSNGKTFDRPVTINASGATIQLADALTMGASRTLSFLEGTFDANDFDLTTGFITTGVASHAAIVMGGGTWTLQAAGAAGFGVGSNWTLTAETSTVKLTSATGVTFNANDKTFNNIWFTGAGTITIDTSNPSTNMGTFNNFRVEGTLPRSVVFKNSSTITVATWTASGAAGTLITMTSQTSGTPWTVSVPSGTIVADYLSLRDSQATGGATFYAGSHSTNVSGNTGWSFTDPPAGPTSGSTLPMMGVGR